MSYANKVNYNFTPEEADELWVNTFGNTAKAYDALGLEIHRNEYSNKNKYGWEIDHIWPIAELENYGLTPDIINSKQNLQPLQWKANRIKSDYFPSFVIEYTKRTEQYCYTLEALNKLVDVLFPEPNNIQRRLISTLKIKIFANLPASVPLN